MAFARDTSTASAAQTDFTISFPYLQESHVEVFKDGVEMTNQNVADTVSYQIVSSTIVRFGAGLAGGEIIVILRNTSQSTRLVDYTTASTLTENDLDTDSLQAFYMAQESIDEADTALGLNAADQWDGESKLINLVADPVSAQDAATRNYVNTVLAASGNVPVPGASKDILVATGATAGDFAFATALDTATQIADDLIDSQHYAAGSIDTEHYANNSVGGVAIAMGSDVQGDILFYNGTNYVRLGAGTNPQYLETRGTSSNPRWASLDKPWSAWSTLDLTNGGADDLTLLNLLTGLSSVSEIQLWVKDYSTDTANQALILQIGDSGGFEITSYDSQSVIADGAGPTVVQQQFTTGYGAVLDIAQDAADISHMSAVLQHLGSNQWTFDGSHVNIAGSASTTFGKGIGFKTLSGTLTQIRATTTGGTAVFDGGTVYIRSR